MCFDIQYIKNVTVAAAFDDAVPATSFTHHIVSMPNVAPDECVIRALNFNGAADDNNLYMVWSNLTNDFIASFCGGSLAPHFPQTRIMLNGPIPNMLEFRIYGPELTGPPLPVNNLGGELTIHMDFIKYRNVATHA
jgi:hypothetical protein